MRRSSSWLGMRVLEVLIQMHMRMRMRMRCLHMEEDRDGAKDNIGDNDRELITKSRRSSSSSSSSSSSLLIKVVKWEGGLKTYSRPTKVKEVIMEFPKHMVCRSDSLYIGQKIPPLSNHQLLQPGHIYFLLPSHLFHSALSFVTVASILSSRPQSSDAHNANNDFLKKKKKMTTYNLCSQPFLIQRSPSGCSRMRISDEFIISYLQYYDDEEQAAPDLAMDDCNTNCRKNTMVSSSLCTTPQLHKEYAQLVQSRRPSHWKPKLSTINETTKTTMTMRRRRRRRRNNLTSSNSMPTAY